MLHATRSASSTLAALLCLALIAPVWSAPAPAPAPQDQRTINLAQGRGSALTVSSRQPLASSRTGTTKTRTTTTYSTTYVATKDRTRTVATTTTTKNFSTTVVRATTTTRTTTQTTSTKKTSTKPSTTTTKATTSTSAKPSATQPAAKKHINAVYYPDWTGSQIPPENVDYSLFDILYFSFAIPAADHTLYWTQWNSVDLLKRLVKEGHKHSSKVCITIGGWTGSAHFSEAVRTADTREKFANNILAMVNEYNADGVDLDWEYPGQAGAPGNTINGNDSANLLLFLQVLRRKFGSGKIISLAMATNVWVDENGEGIKDLRPYAKEIDHVLVMNYDIWGASANPGPNAPYAACAGSWQPEANAVAAIAAWKKAGMPANKLMLGLPSYGYVSDSKATKLISKRSERDAHMEAMEARRIAANARAQMNTGNMRPHLGGDNSVSSLEQRDNALERRDYGDINQFKGSQIQFNQLISNHVLSLSSSGIYDGRHGYTRQVDSCSSTPFVYDQARSTVVTYDDPPSLKKKAEFARSQGLAGTGMWDISGDTADWVLVKATRQGLGI